MKPKIVKETIQYKSPEVVVKSTKIDFGIQGSTLWTYVEVPGGIGILPIDKHNNVYLPCL